MQLSSVQKIGLVVLMGVGMSTQGMANRAAVAAGVVGGMTMRSVAACDSAGKVVDLEKKLEAQRAALEDEQREVHKRHIAEIERTIQELAQASKQKDRDDFIVWFDTLIKRIKEEREKETACSPELALHLGRLHEQLQSSVDYRNISCDRTKVLLKEIEAKKTGAKDKLRDDLLEDAKHIASCNMGIWRLKHEENLNLSAMGVLDTKEEHLEKLEKSSAKVEQEMKQKFESFKNQKN